MRLILSKFVSELNRCGSKSWSRSLAKHPFKQITGLQSIYHLPVKAVEWLTLSTVLQTGTLGRLEALLDTSLKPLISFCCRGRIPADPYTVTPASYPLDMLQFQKIKWIYSITVGWSIDIKQYKQTNKNHQNWKALQDVREVEGQNMVEMRSC